MCVPLRWLLALTLLRLGIAAALPLSPDEAYYWVWSRALAPGYVDHPPMVALWIWLGTALAGDGALGIRLLAPVAAALGSVLLAQAANALFPNDKPGIRAAILLNATLLFAGGAVTMTPDTPLLLFWTATIWAVARSTWPLAGLAAGLALDSKYTAVLLAPALLLWLASTGGWRRRGPWIAAATAVLLFAPVIAWNAVHGWASFAKQGGRVADWQPARALQFLGELIGGQIGLATPIIAILFAAGFLAALKRWRQPSRGLLACLLLVPGVVFLQHALGDRVQANWPGVLYPQAAIAAALLGRRWQVPGAALGFALTAFVTLQGLFAPLKLPGDPLLLRLAGWPELAAQAEAARVAAGADYLAADNYGIAALLARDTQAPVLAAEGRWALFDLPASRPTGTGLLLRSARRSDAPDPEAWASAEPAGTLQRERNGMVAERFTLYSVRATPHGTPIVTLPHPR